jgi:Ca-activated chloride channel family protein
MKNVSLSSLSLVVVLAATPTLPLSTFGQEGSRTAGSVETQASQKKTDSVNTDDQSVIVNTHLVTLTVSVTDARGLHVTGLDRKDFTISDNKVPQQISFFSDDDLPASVAVVFDVSGSMSGKRIATAKEALAEFIKASHPKDEYFLIDFSSQARLLVDRTPDAEVILRKLTFVEPRGQTALYDATHLALNEVARGTRAKRVVLIISDGQDNNSRHTLDEVRRQLRESDVLVYAIGTNPGTMRPDMWGRMALEELASASGGRAFFPRNSTQMDEAFERIALELRQQYSIGYRPSNFISDGKWHRLRVNVSPVRAFGRLSVRSRGGYYARGTFSIPGTSSIVSPVVNKSSEGNR